MASKASWKKSYFLRELEEKVEDEDGKHLVVTELITKYLALSRPV